MRASDAWLEDLSGGGEGFGPAGDRILIPTKQVGNC